MITTLFVMGFPREMTEADLLELFHAYGAVVSVHIARDRLQGHSLSYGFVEMTGLPGAEQAVAALDNSVIGGRKLIVRMANKRPAFETP